MFKAVSLSLFVVTIFAMGAGATQQFSPAAYYVAGHQNTPYRIVPFDWNQDGNLDLVVANDLSSEITVLSGRGDGTFRETSAFSVPVPVGIAVGDFNGDGLPDFAAVQYGGTGLSTLGIYLGNSEGSVRLASTYSLGIASQAIVAADFNNDGRLDLAVTNGAEKFGDKNGGVMVFLGRGDGGFLPPTTYTTVGGFPYGISASDLNGDGRVDLVITEYLPGECIAVMLNQENGTFAAPVTYSTYGPSPASDVVIADLNHDGVPDLVVATPSVYDGVNVFLGAGDGTFGSPTYYPKLLYSGEGTYTITVADFNLDGNLDIAAASGLGASPLYYGNGDGTFQLAVPIRDQLGHNGAQGLAVGDFNGDGAPDLAFAITYGRRIAVLLNTK